MMSGRPSTIYWLMRGVLLESIRRRETSVVALFMGLFAVGAVIARVVGAESEAAATFIINLGMSLAWILSMIVTILLAGRQFPDEQEQRSLYPLLAKPVSRSQYILGKWLAVWLIGSLTAAALNVLALATAPWPGSVSPGLLMQALGLEVIAIGVAAAVAIVLSINVPKALTFVLCGLLVFAGGPLLNLVKGRAGMGRGGRAWQWLLDYVPDFGRLDLLNQFSGGADSLGLQDFAGRIIVGLLTIGVAIAGAVWLMERRSL